MIFTEKKITINNNECKIDSPVVLYRGDYNVEVRFTIVSSPYKYSNKQETNVIEQTEASYGQLVIKTPGDKAPIFSEITATKRGAITFTITAEMIDEVDEIGDYTFQIRLLDENKESRATIPEVKNGIEIREPIASEDVSTTNEVGVATVGYAVTTAGTTEDTFDNQGNYNKTTWATGDRITAQKLNKMETGIDEINKKVASGGTGGGEVDLSGYVTKEIGNASQITFSDGQTFQSKLDAGTLKGEKGDTGATGAKGDTGEQGPQGLQGPKGDPGEKGDTGLQGPKGDKGDTGEQGPAGADGVDGQTPNIAIGTVTTLEAGANATAEITGTTPNLTLNLGIPKGADGNSGTEGIVASTTEILPNVVLFGDSITDTNTNGMWVKYIQEYAKFKSLTNYARGYCTWTFKSDSNYNITDTSDANIGNNVIWNQFNRMKNDIDKGTITEPDCIVILAGTNDALQDKTLGDVNTVFNGAAQSDDITTLTNLCASIRYVCELIMNTYPRCQIILCTPLQAKELNTTTAAKSVGDTIKQCASVMGCKVIDQWSNSGIYQYKEKTNNVHMRDNVHLNDIGGQDVAKFLAREFYNKINLRHVNASQEPVAPAITLKSISATFNQGNTAVYTSTSLNELKSMLTVTATYSDNSTRTITDYELSGTLTVGTSTITVTKGGLTTTFDVIVSESTSGGEGTPTTVTYFRNELLGTCAQGVWEDSVQIPNQVIPSGSKLKQFKCNAFANNGTAYLAAFTKNNSDFTPVYVKQVTFNKGENTFNLDYTCEQDIYFGWKTVIRGFIGMDLSTINGTPAGSQQYSKYWSLKNDNLNPSYVPEIGVPVNNLIDTNNEGIGFDCLLVVEQ